MDSRVSAHTFCTRSLNRAAKASCVRADNLNIHEVSCEWSGTSFRESLAPYRGFFLPALNGLFVSVAIGLGHQFQNILRQRHYKDLHVPQR